MPSRFYDPNNTEQQRLLRAAQNGDLESRRFTDSVGRSGFETIDGDLRMRRYDSGQTHFEQRGPGGEMRAFGPTTSPRDLVTPPTGPVIAPDRTEADRLARAISDAGGTDNGTVGRDTNWMAQNFAARNGARREDAPRFSNLHDYDYERSFGSAAAERAIASGMSRTPTFDQSFGTPAQRAAANERIEKQRMAYLEREAGLSPLGIAGSAAGGSEGRAAAMRELEALRMQRAQENARQSADLARREGFANEQTVAGITAQGKIDAAAAAAQGQVDAAREQGQARRDAANRRAEAIENSAKIQAEAAGKRPIPLGGGLGAVRNDDGSYTVIGQTGTGASEQRGVTLKPGESYYNPQSGALFVAPGADRTSIEAEIRGLTDALAKALTTDQREAIEKQLTDARERLAKLPAGPQAGGAGSEDENKWM